uniref:VWFA domain-containing protein n=1 Tax=Acrobeloides nanus TaxID=290746 RepID=A0A914D596_9BILA
MDPNWSRKMSLGLGDHLDVDSVQVAISQTYYIDGGTNIESGMTKALADVFGNPGDRATVPDIMIVITDGQDFSNVTGAQQVAASRGITVFSVGVGAYVDYNQLVAIAGSTNRAYNATNFDFLDEILADICGNLGGSNSTNSVIAPRLPFSSEIAPKTCVFDVKSGFTKQEFCTARPYCYQIC